MAVGISFITSIGNSSSLSTFTFSGTSIGSEASDRVVVVGVAPGSGGRVSGVTIGGNAATQIASATATNEVSLWGLLVPSGTTADIVVTTAATAGGCAIGVWSLTGTNGNVGAHSTAIDTDENNSGTLVLNVKADGGVIGFGVSQSSPSWSWGGVTERFETTVSGGIEASGGDALTVSDSAAYNVTYTSSSGLNTVACAASFVVPELTAAAKFMHYRRLRI